MTEVFDLGLEVVGIQLPAKEDEQGYRASNKYLAEMGKDVVLKPLGKLVCKPWKIPTFGDHDLPKALREETFGNAPDTYTFWLESDILEHMFWEVQELVPNEKTSKMEAKMVKKSFVGMKMSAQVRRLQVQGFKESLWVLDGVANMYCSFYNLILNDLMYRPWKGVRRLTEQEQAAKVAKGSDDGL